MEEQGESSETASVTEAPDAFQVHVQLPTGETLSFQAKRSSNVRDLKMLVEVTSGVPSDLFTLVHNRGDNNAIDLNDETKMADVEVQSEVSAPDESVASDTQASESARSVTFELCIPLWWQRFVDRCMKRDNRQILKRICIKMNQISSEERAFVAAFIAAQKGDGQLFQSLLSGDVKVDVEQTVLCSGRTLLHAAVAGGNFSCAAAIFMNGGWALLSRADCQGVTPMDMAKNTNQPDLVELLDQYVELRSREASGNAESAVGKTSENDVEIRSREASENESAIGKTSEDDLKGLGVLRVDGEKNEANEKSKQDNSARSAVDDTILKVRDELTREANQRRENKEEFSEGSFPVRTVPQRMLNRGLNPQLKLHMPLRACRSLNTHDRSPATNPVLTCVEEIKGLSGKAIPGVRQVEEKLPRVNTPPSSPRNSPRMGRKLVPSLLNPERPGSPILRPRSPLSPRPKTPLLSRPRSPTSPAMRTNVIRTCSSPEPRRRAITFHGGENEDDRQMSSQMEDFLMSHYDSREKRPWNVWKTSMRKTQFDVSDDDDDSSSEDENDKLTRFLQTSSRRKTFEMWVTDKEAALARKQTVLAGIAKQEAMTKKREDNWRQLTGKTYREWLEEKRDNNTGKAAEIEQRERIKARQEATAKRREANLRQLIAAKAHQQQEWFEEKGLNKNQGKSAESDERKAEAIRKYQEWMRAKDAEALAREDRLREEAAAKFTETKQKRDDKMQSAWYKKKLFNM